MKLTFKHLLLPLALLAMCAGGAHGQGVAYLAPVNPSTALEAAHIISTSPAKFISLVGYNSGPAQFVQLHNGVAVPPDGAVPLVSFSVPAGGNFSLFYPTPLFFSTGLVVCNSTTAATKTAGGANCLFTVQSY